MTDDRCLLTVVGCAGSVPGPDSGASSYLLQRDGFTVVLDVGSGSISSLQRLTDIATLNAVIISHSHNDHWADLNALAYLRRRSNAGQLLVIAPADLPTDIDCRSSLTVEQARPGPRQLGPFALRMGKVAHTEQSWAMRLDDALCYTGDTEPCAELDTLALDARVLLAEASGFDGDGLRGHLSARDAGRLAAQSRTRLLVLTHLRPWLDTAALLAEASLESTSPTISASVGLRVVV